MATRKRAALHSVNYVVELFLDEQDHVQRTKVHHVQSQEEETWDGWDGNRLLEFFEGREELAVSPEAEVTAASTRAFEAQTPSPAPHVVIQPGSLEIQPAGPGEAIRLRVGINLSDHPVRGRMQYSAQVWAKRVGHHGSLTVADEKGSVHAAPEIQLDLDGSPLPAGAYRTFAAIMLTPLDAMQAPVSMLMEGSPLQVV